MNTTMRDRADVISAVRSAIADALGIAKDEVVAEAALLDDLGAESIDLLDILFRLERSIGVKIKAADLAEYIQGGIPDDEFSDEENIISAVGLTYLKTVMPQIDPDELAGKLRAEEILNLFTVENLVEMVCERIAPTDDTHN